MNILYSLNSAQIGGAENHVLDLVRGFSDDNNVTVVLPSGEMVSEFKKAGAEVIVDSPSMDLDPFYILRVRKVLKEKKVEIFHGHQLKTVINGLIASFMASTTVRIAHVHSPLSGWQIPLYKKIPNLIVNFVVVNLLATKVIALTEATKKERVRGEGIFPSKIKIIPNGIPIQKFNDRHGNARAKYLDKFNLSSEAVIIGNLNRLTEEKGVDVLIQAVFELRSLAPEIFKKAQVLIAGEGHLRQTLEKLVSKEGLDSKIHFLGFLSEKDYPTFYKGLDLFVFPSLHEGFGYVLAEAMASKVLTVSSNLPVLKELTKNGEFGYHFEKGDPKDLAETIVKALDDPRRKDRIEKARDWVENNFSNEQFIKNYKSFYEELLNK